MTHKNHFTDSTLLFYQTDDGRTHIEVKLDHETVWLTQKDMTNLFQTSKQNISFHIKNIYDEGELPLDSTIKEYLTVQKESNRQVSRKVIFYNLELIIAVGYRVKSHRGTQFRIWATNLLKEYIVKGFTLDDNRLKNANLPSYFDELLERIRDIRSSEKMFWQKILAIFATSTDYSPKTEQSQLFFKTVQNKMHCAAHGHTAAEIIATRADAKKENMGLTSWVSKAGPSRSEVTVAKNYLYKEELEKLNLIVSLYLDFAELQAKAKKAM